MTCGHAESRVIDTRPVQIGEEVATRRRRECLACEARFSTLEVAFQRKRGGRAPKFTDDEVTMWRQLSRAGVSDTQIARLAGASVQTVYRKLYPVGGEMANRLAE